MPHIVLSNRLSSFLVRPTCLFLMLVAPGASVLAQVETAKITGRVTDPTGAIIPGAQVTIIHVDTNRRFAALTNNAGVYVSVPLPVGRYIVEVQSQGFKRTTRSGITLQIQDTAAVDISLQIGDLSETIAVEADAPLLNSTEATQGQVVDNKRIVDLPLNGRNYAQLGLLSAGTVEPARGSRFGGFSASGQRTTQNNYLLDGVDNNTNQNSAQGSQAEAVQPSIDAIQEFKVNTNSFSSEYGRAAGGVLNAVIKAGSNEFHGTAFGFLRNEIFDAKNFFDPAGQDKPPFKRSQFGGSVGGPVIKNKVFFFGDYEGTRIRESSTNRQTVPTLAMRSGDFTQTGITIYDPLTYNATTRIRAPFPGNKIPNSRIDPVARIAAGWYPNPQNSELLFNYLSNPPVITDRDKFDIRADYNVRSGDSVYFRYSSQENFSPASPSLPPPAYGGGATDWTNTGRNMALVWNHIFASNLIASTRLSWNRLLTEGLPTVDHNINADMGLKGVEQKDPGGAVFNITGVASLGIGAFLPQIADSQTRQLVNDITWNKGSHIIKCGVNIMWLQQYLRNNRHASGVFSFNGAFTRDSSTLRQGHGFADFLLGVPVSAQVSTSIAQQMRMPLYHFYVQDQWKVLPRLTLNYGLRYELDLPWVEKNNKINNFDIDTNPSNPVFVPSKDGSRADRATLATDMNNFAPRFGFAYQAMKHTVVRGGYGVYIANIEGGTAALNPPFLITAQISTNSITPAFYLGEGVTEGILTPQKASGLSFFSTEIHARQPYSQQWLLTTQHEFARSWLFEIGYSGSKANKLLQRTDPNYALPGPGNINNKRRYKTALWPGTNISVGPLGSVFRLQYDGNSLYHAMVTRLEKRFSGGFTLQSFYTWSKSIGDVCGLANSGRESTSGCDPQNPLDVRSERALDSQHMAHRFVTSYIWEIPLGQGRRWGSGWNGYVDAIVGGWSTAGIVTITSGMPLTPLVNGNPANSSSPNRPNLVGNPILDRGERTLARWFNTDAFVPNNQYSYGNAGRNILIGPGDGNIDFALYKRFKITERINMQFRFEAFNFFNTPHFSDPNVTLNTPTFGQINGAGRPRNLQFGMKIIF